ncbi:MAG: STAS-like domain-containing protein [Thalassolituus oleivorans]|uniref:STAS-like domain-containing protein n=1 Tax=Thalassolituus oleivorans TaxID=187493 RepID=UPI001B3DA0B7|nr:STAS-like domain-containing protein [Thalassolituus oleivorans]MBQ0729012.1 STAS-like domain-containing protein [Thalassolituus oleivorans]MBQ0782156.1 STAS-like domain-containing protein [Thalassolituus oleivorans]MDF1640025.1 STAS-like domain-containing protein [Thalassolituus oleivorans]
MKTFKMSQIFGAVCGDGTRAVSFLQTTVIPALNASETVEFDFSGVKVLNSSFSNALFGNLIKLKGQDVLKSIKIVKASDFVRSEIKSGIIYGAKHHNNVAA